MVQVNGVDQESFVDTTSVVTILSQKPKKSRLNTLEGLEQFTGFGKLSQIRKIIYTILLTISQFLNGLLL